MSTIIQAVERSRIFRWTLLVSSFIMLSFAGSCLQGCALEDVTIIRGRKLRKSGTFAIAIALGSYSDVYGRLPPPVIKDSTGKALSSWRLAILGVSPDGWPADVDLTRPWKDPKNAKLTKKRLRFYSFSYDEEAPRRPKKNNQTNVVAVVGPGTAFSAKKPRKIEKFPRDTIILIEVGDSGIPWAAPGDLRVSDLKKLAKHGADGKGFHVAFADLEVWYLRKDVPADILKKLCLVKEAAKNDRAKLLRPYVLGK